MLKGTLDDFALPDVFRLVSLAKKTGQLDVVRKAGEGKVFFREGEVYFAESSLTREPLGQKLIRGGVLTEGQLRKALDEHKETGERVGAVLVNSGAVTVEQVATAIRQQIEDAAFDLLRWELGEFTWEPGSELDVEIPIGVSVENLIMEASRRLDELEVIKRKIPSMETLLAMAPKPPEGALEINITPEEWRVLVLVDGTRSLDEIAASTGLDEFQAMRTMYGLVSAGLVEVARSTTGAHVAPEPAVVATPADVAEPVQVAEPEPEQAPEPEPEPAQAAAPEPEPEQAPEPEPEPAQAAAPEPVLEDTPLDIADVLAEESVAAPPPAPPTAPEELAFGGTDDAEDAEPVTEPVAAVPTPPEDWFSDPDVSVDEFDAPGPDDIQTEVPEPTVDADTDSFLGDLLDDEPAAQTPPAEEPAATEPASTGSAPPPPAPADADESEDADQVDRAAVVRELAGLFDEPPSEPEGDGSTKSKKSVARDETGKPVKRKRVEDDDQVNKGLISRLIDGVKGL